MGKVQVEIALFVLLTVQGSTVITSHTDRVASSDGCDINPGEKIDVITLIYCTAEGLIKVGVLEQLCH